ncbi:proline iminopeptidase-family hydrolase [Lentzea sp. NPDC042327]|uniref:proline iminopeptidase-family hydrolase n=1 Tax=Lentzea sp. NPDC042327 TaxID=3154801 RepID=UPI0033C29F88
MPLPFQRVLPEEVVFVPFGTRVPLASTKGTVAFRDYRTWYRVTGELGGDRPAVVAVHGGPGSTHDYLLPLARLADDGWPVVHYDQLGNGGSTHLPDADPAFWTVELFLEELDNLLTSLGIADNYVLFGQSWGGPLCAKHAAAGPAGLRGLVVANAPASYPIWLQEMARLRADLPRETQEALLRHEAAGTYDDREYLAAMRVFYDRHVCRARPWPRDFVSSYMEIYNDPTVYYAMNGPNEFHVIGSLKDFSVIDDLPAIDTPTLLLSGRYDEATPTVMRPYEEHVKGARWEIFENSAHLPHLEEPELFHEVLVDFLKGL